MNDLKFRPKVKGDSDEMLVTSSNDGDFKTWILTEDNDIYRKLCARIVAGGDTDCVVVNPT